MGVARAWSRSEIKKFLPSLSVNLINYLKNVWSAMSLSLLVPEEKKLPISINFQKSVYPLYISRRWQAPGAVKKEILSFKDKRFFNAKNKNQQIGEA